MAQLTPYLTSVSHYRRPSGSPRLRVIAALLVAMLVLGGLLPGAAYAGEADSEGEGSAPPESITEPGEEPEFDPGGEDTALEGLPAVAGGPGGDAEDTGEGEPVETEPELDTEAPPPAADPAGTVPETASTDEEPAPSQAPLEAPAETEPESAPAPGYETAYPPPSTPVENQPLAAPPAPPEGEPEASEEAVPAVVATGPPPAPPSSDQSLAPRPIATTVDRNGGGRSLAGLESHTVQPGECLWSIAEALLPVGAGNEEIAQEVQRLWQLNASRIGTGDPDMLPAGVVLRLH